MDFLNAHSANENNNNNNKDMYIYILKQGIDIKRTK